ncbi:hypothetical protein GCM10010169_34600 [Micromonospora fulviviridis]|nr:hypothetical protein GCM10010169_34600 [Micromonospora fulviviridis]
MAAFRVGRSGPGRPRVRPDHVIAGKGCGCRAIRAELRRRGIGHTIPEGADQQVGRRSPGGRPPVFDKQLYKRRNVVERCFNRLKQCRSVATRYDKTATSYQATSPSPRYRNGCKALKTPPSPAPEAS